MHFGRRSLRLAYVIGGCAVAVGCGNSDAKESPQGATESKTTVATTAAKAPAATSPAEKQLAAPAPTHSQSATGAQAAQPAAAPKHPTQAEADALMTAAVAEYKQPKRSCNAVLSRWLGGAAYASPAALAPASYAAAHCAEDNAEYLALKIIGSMLAQVDPASEKYAYVPRALFGLGKRDDAWTALLALGKKHPGEPSILYLESYQAEKQKAYAPALKMVDATVKAIHASKDPYNKPLEWRAELLRQKAHLFTGDLAAADKDIDNAKKAGAPDSEVEEVRKEMVPMKITKVGVDVSAPAKTYLGIYHLAGKTKIVPELVTVELMNFTAKDQVFKVEVEIPGVTDKVTKSMTVLKGKNEELHLTPPLKADFKPAGQTAERSARINVKVSMPGEGDKVVYEDAAETTIYPRDQMPWQFFGEKIAGAWITPQSPAIEEFVAAAKKRAQGGSLPGADQAPTLPQVKALYDELKARGMSYVLVTMGNGGQHVRLPAESIKSTNALCLDGAILFATLMEKIGFQPFLVTLPSHAFVGWHAGPKDDPKTKVYYLETTMVGSASFEDAVLEGAIEAAKEEKEGRFANGASQKLDITAMRAEGITQQPYE